MLKKQSESAAQKASIYNVHADIEVRAKVVGIEATSMLEAAKNAADVDLGGVLRGYEQTLENFKVLNVERSCSTPNGFTVDPLIDGEVDFSRTRTVMVDTDGLLDLPGAEGPIEPYAVHVFTDVRVTFAGIEASSAEEAARKVREGDFDLHELLRRGRYAVGGVEVAEVEYTESAPGWYLVDPVIEGKVDYEHSVELGAEFERIERALEMLPESPSVMSP